MILILKNSQIIGIDKKILDLLDVNFDTLSKTIKEIELEIASLKNESINLNGQYFQITPLNILSVENLKVFDLEKAFSSEEETIPSSLPEFGLKEENTQPPAIKPSVTEESTPSLSPEAILKEENIQTPTFEPSLTEETAPSLSPEAILKEENIQTPTFEPSLTEETAPSLSPESSFQEKNQQVNENIINDITKEKKEHKEQLKIPTIPNNLTENKNTGEIVISFEDDLEEIEKMLDASAEEAKKEMQKEIEKAANDLSIDLETITMLKNELFEMFKNEKTNFYHFINEKDFELLHKTAHKLKGGALNLRLTNLALILKKIDELSKKRSDIHKIKYLIDKFYIYLDKIENEKNDNIPQEVKQLILQTIESYLKNQNEKNFIKDKKYIEQLLHRKIDSIEDLQNILKG